MLWRPHTQTWACSPVSLSTLLNVVSYKHWWKRPCAVCAIPHQESSKGQTKFIFFKFPIHLNIHFMAQTGNLDVPLSSMCSHRDDYTKGEGKVHQKWRQNSSRSASPLFFLFSLVLKSFIMLGKCLVGWSWVQVQLRVKLPPTSNR